MRGDCAQFKSAIGVQGLVVSSEFLARKKGLLLVLDFPRGISDLLFDRCEMPRLDGANPRIKLETIETGSTAGLKRAGFFVLA